MPALDIRHAEIGLGYQLATSKLSPKSDAASHMQNIINALPLPAGRYFIGQLRQRFGSQILLLASLRICQITLLFNPDTLYQLNGGLITGVLQH
ncbi:hypothetical protein D9M69_571380 [compost metagenome]